MSRFGRLAAAAPKSYIFATISIVVLLAAFLSTPLFAAQRLACYYGAGRLDELSKFDIVVLQPEHYTAEDITKLRDAGVHTILGYVSLGEDDRLRRGDGKGPGGQASWYLDEFTGKGFKTVGSDGLPDASADWDSYYVNPSNREWQRLVREQVESIRGLGMSGVFADTVLIPRDVFKAKTERRLDEGMMALVGKLKGWMGGGKVYLNNGQEGLDRWERKIDGIVIENDADAEGFWDEIGTQFRRTRVYRERGLVVQSLFYVARAEDLPRVCGKLSEIGLSSSLYVRDADGLALKTLPDYTCP